MPGHEFTGLNSNLCWDSQQSAPPTCSSFLLGIWGNLMKVNSGSLHVTLAMCLQAKAQRLMRQMSTEAMCSLGKLPNLLYLCHQLHLHFGLLPFLFRLCVVLIQVTSILQSLLHKHLMMLICNSHQTSCDVPKHEVFMGVVVVEQPEE